ncbi:beta-1,6-N-acetylglucosaminyltransferase [Sedimentitalea sp. JM2-8]|uniref:Peptide O-xylosyltransferase n=1 Tax=Sedimentitalea xiamensis TaxID=3050037 RepID=A0ABT7FA36_9RHOB|nr:beta-1,6-N-acetylglucosaminyltransferase [Sedimentitalea xiamensis]MDK3071714.1 beta-1,6-N-acetylglucosaminyltransferase [Sedimentitalea xiamensis]
MTVGIVMLVHDGLERAEQVVRHWTAAGCPVVLHVDRNTPDQAFRAFEAALGHDPLVRFCKRHRCQWGTWGIVAATQAASELMLETFGQVDHVYLSSGSCLPLRPARDLAEYLKARPRTDFIESATTEDVPWTVGGLDEERFTLRFPFSWRRNRRLFDRYVALQRRLGLRRRIPPGLVPHMGSQWWCLTRRTLSAILQDPNRPVYDRYFRRVWIPDESYFQTLARLFSGKIESRSLTLSRFDFQGKPHIFYDDHLKLLRRSGFFVARKVWPGADGLYRAFLSGGQTGTSTVEPDPGAIDRIFSRAVDRRTSGRPGLYMQSRMPRPGWEKGITANAYSVFQGFDAIFGSFDHWLAKATGACAHGHLFAAEKVEFAAGHAVARGALSDSAAKRDYAPEAFLTSLIWNTRGERQCFQFAPSDRQQIAPFLARDRNARIHVISGAWAVPLFQSNRNFADLRREAARLQKIESAFLKLLRSGQSQAHVRIWTMAEFVENPMEPLQQIISETGEAPVRNRLTEVPIMADLSGFGQFLQNLKNQGMHPYLTGDFPVDTVPVDTTPEAARPYLVR